MDICEVCKTLAARVHPPLVEPDYVLDNQIRNALLEEAAVPTPPGAWERLRKAIIERRPTRSGGKAYGMWILDEPFRDPPASTPHTLSARDLERAQRIYDNTRAYRIHQVPEIVFSNLVPSFVALMNL